MNGSLHGPIEGIFFDLGWTLVKPSSGHWLFSDAAERYLADYPDRKKVYATMEKHWGDLHSENHLWLSYKQEYAAFYEAYRRTSQMLELGWSEKVLGELTEDIVYSENFYQVYDGVPALLERLAGRYKLGVISDTVPTVGERLHRLGLLKYFSSVTLSCHLNARKPAPKMFAHALLASGVPGERAVFVDDLEGNLDAAGKLGFQGVQICAGPFVVRSERHLTIDNICEIEQLLL